MDRFPDENNGNEELERRMMSSLRALLEPPAEVVDNLRALGSRDDLSIPIDVEGTVVADADIISGSMHGGRGDRREIVVSFDDHNLVLHMDGSELSGYVPESWSEAEMKIQTARQTSSVLTDSDGFFLIPRPERGPFRLIAINDDIVLSSGWLLA